MYSVEPAEPGCGGGKVEDIPKPVITFSLSTSIAFWSSPGGEITSPVDFISKVNASGVNSASRSSSPFIRSMSRPTTYSNSVGFRKIFTPVFFSCSTREKSGMSASGILIIPSNSFKSLCNSRSLLSSSMALAIAFCRRTFVLLSLKMYLAACQAIFDAVSFPSVSGNDWICARICLILSGLSSFRPLSVEQAQRSMSHSMTCFISRSSGGISGLHFFSSSGMSLSTLLPFSLSFFNLATRSLCDFLFEFSTVTLFSIIPRRSLILSQAELRFHCQLHSISAPSLQTRLFNRSITEPSG
mmetsp:Transcript_10482/g.16562  ORF Transcript_10482/g.16562 Transcript_10482/m.16562 type:complete len:299 (+) Transcript_10482:8240-9136(+)